MPLYEYECDDCGRRTEVIQRFDDAPLAACPECSGPVRRLISAPAVQFKGSGWYVTDYAGKGGGSKRESAADSKAGSGEGAAGGSSEGGKKEKAAKSASSE